MDSFVLLGIVGKTALNMIGVSMDFDVIKLESLIENGVVNVDYCFIGLGYVLGEFGLDKDLRKARKWLSKYYDDYVAGKFQIEDEWAVVQALYNLVVLKADYLKNYDNVTKEKRERVGKSICDVLYHIVDLCDSLKVERGNDRSAELDMIYGAGVALANGYIEYEEYKVEVISDIKYAIKAWKFVSAHSKRDMRYEWEKILNCPECDEETADDIIDLLLKKPIKESFPKKAEDVEDFYQILREAVKEKKKIASQTSYECKYHFIGRKELGLEHPYGNYHDPKIDEYDDYLHEPNYDGVSYCELILLNRIHKGKMSFSPSQEYVYKVKSQPILDGLISGKFLKINDFERYELTNKSLKLIEKYSMIKLFENNRVYTLEEREYECIHPIDIAKVKGFQYDYSKLYRKILINNILCHLIYSDNDTLLKQLSFFEIDSKMKYGKELFTELFEPCEYNPDYTNAFLRRNGLSQNTHKYWCERYRRLISEYHSLCDEG